MGIVVCVCACVIVCVFVCLWFPRDALCDSVCFVSVCACVLFYVDLSECVLRVLFEVDCVMLHGVFVCVDVFL